MSERKSRQAGCKGLAVASTSAAPRRFNLHPGVTQERPILADVAASGRPRAAGKGDTRGV
jgi:hypothetical protein